MSEAIDLETELAEIRRAAERLAPHVRETPTVYSYTFSEALGVDVHLKLENLQRTGSFKVRGALNRILTLEPEQRARGLVAASAGNHAQGVALAAQLAGCGAKIVMPLDVTHHALTTRPRVDAFSALGTKVGDMVAAWTNFFERFDKEKYGSEGAPLHDPCVIAYLINPDLFEGRYVNVEIETESELTLGMTVADWWRVTDRKPNAMFMGKLDAESFFDLLTERLARL